MRHRNKNPLNAKHIYLMMNKPSGYVCSTVSDRSPVVFNLVPEEIKKYCLENKLNLHTVGRLDKETGGLLILTTDGDFSHKLMVPENHISKVYETILSEAVSSVNQRIYIEEFAKGVMLPPDKKFPQQQSRPAKLVWLSEKKAQITVTEGKFHEVRRMFAAMKNQVVELHRISISSLNLPGNLNPGECRILSQWEIQHFL